MRTISFPEEFDDLDWAWFLAAAYREIATGFACIKVYLNPARRHVVVCDPCGHLSDREDRAILRKQPWESVDPMLIPIIEHALLGDHSLS